ncbi:3-hexulose-6-phosphate synthase [Candidatus Sodalis endolongispinus]|uniref:3-hexulose-6-phosphate synthase n=1 Tax=Candidatus Sodalis endolongispinus TaxID=2812662 RepID=A0ABS5YAF0_9GAMM|nr:3-hexulose-6-phosphate synthase [Candidatus Sodalis endolongispinus]MBT9431990.1 3-hexulose-6-phosphate synthase [Candidatus Sodalis endolongispinus]
MKLQLALDELPLDEALALAESVLEYVDIIEIGTPFVIARGMEAVRRFRERFQEKKILSDEKIMDGGYFESQLAFDAGADYVTALGVTDILTVKGCLRAAHDSGKALVIDMICVEDLPGRIAELEAAGVKNLAVHTGADQQAAGRQPIEDLKVMKQHARHSAISVAGGINSLTIQQYVDQQPDVIIVGSAITKADDPVLEARLIKTAMLGGAHE